jgi:hypothetical protein
MNLQSRYELEKVEDMLEDRQAKAGSAQIYARGTTRIRAYKSSLRGQVLQSWWPQPCGDKRIRVGLGRSS